MPSGSSSRSSSSAPTPPFAWIRFTSFTWATNALDQVRKAIWNDARRSGRQVAAVQVKGSRWALLRNPEHLTANQAATLAQVAKLNSLLYRAYLLKEQLRMVFHVGYHEAVDLLERWIHWARALPHRSVREAGADDHLLPCRYRGYTSARRQQRTNGVPQHQGPVDRSARVWIPLPSGADSPLRAHTRRPMPTAARPTSALNGPTDMPQDPEIDARIATGDSAERHIVAQNLHLDAVF